LYATAFSQAIQVYFIVRVNPESFPISYSRHYAKFGIPLSIVGAGLAATSLVDDWRRVGCLVTALFTGLLWLFLISLHYDAATRRPAADGILDI
jgi:hypothetical protein